MHRLGLVPHIHECVFDHVADRYDADERASSTTGKWRNLHAVMCFIIDFAVSGLSATRYLTRHDSRQRLSQRTCASLGERSHYVTFRQNADHPLLRVKDNERADLAFSDKFGSRLQGWQQVR